MAGSPLDNVRRLIAFRLQREVPTFYWEIHDAVRTCGARLQEPQLTTFADYYWSCLPASLRRRTPGVTV